MLTPSIVFALTVLLTSAAAQGDGIIAGCTSEEQQNYIAALPNSEACSMAFSDVLSPENLTEAEYNTSLRVFCSEDCGGAMVEFSTVNCRNLDFAARLRLLCLPRETGEDRCSSIFPTLLDNREVLISNLSSCSGFNTECPVGCANALMTVVSQFGCCYQSVYNNTDVINMFQQEGSLTAGERQVFQDISQSSLWEACNVTLTAPCTGDSFPGTSELDIGVCTNIQLGTYIATTLGQACLNSFTTVYTTTTPTPAMVDGVCQPGCSGQVSRYFRQTCLDPFAADSINTSCFRTDGEIGSCFYTIGPAANRPDFFSDVGFSGVETTCFADPTASISGPCRSGCQAALQEVKDQLGCCYQSIYNNTFYLDSLRVLNQISAEQRAFFVALGTQDLWESCEVSLQPQCIGDPYAVAAGALQQLAASIVMVMCVVGLSFII